MTQCQKRGGEIQVTSNQGADTGTGVRALSFVDKVCKDIFQADCQIIEQGTLKFRHDGGFFLVVQVSERFFRVLRVNVAERKAPAFKNILLYGTVYRVDNPVFPDAALVCLGLGNAYSGFSLP